METAHRSEDLTFRERWSYGSGEIASNLVWNMVTGFLLVYYTDVAMLPVAALGTLMLTTRILDAVFDFGVGVLVDRTHSRWGKARPYLLFAAIPFGLMTVATFTVPSAADASTKVFYAYLTFTILGLLYSFLYVPYAALLPMVTRNEKEKVRLSTLRTVGTCLGSILVYGFTLPMVGFFGRGDQHTGFTISAAVIGAVSTLSFLVVFANCKERYSQPKAKVQVAVLKSLGQLVRNPVWVINTLLVLLIFIKIGLMVSCLPYFTKEVMGAPWMISVILSLLSFVVLAGGLIAGGLLVRCGRRATNITALLISAAMLGTLPFLEAHPVIFTAIFVATNLVGGILQVTTFTMGADAVDLHEMKFGYRAEGLLSSSISLSIKLGMAIGVSITAFALAWANYTPHAASAESISAIRWVFYGVQIGVLLLQALCIAFYRRAEVAAISSIRVARSAA